MPEEESVSSLILERIEVIKSAIEDIEKVGCVKDLDTNADSAWENSKILIDDLHSHTQKLKNEFYKIYDCRIKNVPDPTKEVDNGMPTVDKTLHIDREKNEKSSEKTIEKLKENIGSTSLEKAPTPLKVYKGEESQAIADSKSCENKEKNAESTATVLDSSIGAIQEWQGSDVIDTSIQDSEENPPESKPTIRLVSLSKLIDPKLKSAFTESTPILISSDEESSVVSNGVSKSKKTSSSDKPAKEEKRKTRNSQETKDIRMINKKIETPRKRNSREKNNDRVSSRGSSIQVEGKNKNSTKNSSKKKEAIENCFADGDVKFSYEVYVPLPLVKYEELNAYYCKNKDIFEIKSPNKIMKLQSCKRILRSNNELSKDFEKPSLKKRRISLAFADNNQNSDADQPMNVESSTASDLIKDISQGEEKV